MCGKVFQQFSWLAKSLIEKCCEKNNENIKWQEQFDVLK